MIEALCTLAAVIFLILAICVAVLAYMVDTAPEFPSAEADGADDGEML